MASATFCRRRIGKPDVITGMRYGGTRYKFDRGAMVDHDQRTGQFHATWYEKGGPGQYVKKTAVVSSMRIAKGLLCRKAQ